MQFGKSIVSLYVEETLIDGESVLVVLRSLRTTPSFEAHTHTVRSPIQFCTTPTLSEVYNTLVVVVVSAASPRESGHVVRLPSRRLDEAEELQFGHSADESGSAALSREYRTTQANLCRLEFKPRRTLTLTAKYLHLLPTQNGGR